MNSDSIHDGTSKRLSILERFPEEKNAHALNEFNIRVRCFIHLLLSERPR